MSFPLRVGLFPYLNVQPLVFGLRSEPDFEVVLDFPSRVADRFRAGELDLAMVPSFEAATMGEAILDGLCIGCDGAVETVSLHHRVPLREVRSLALDEASRTSSALSKILIAQASGRAPRCLPYSPAGGAVPDADALLVIGDPAFNFAVEGFERLDLGEAWQRGQALPFVFAVMAAHPRALRAGLSAALHRATRRGLQAAPDIARSYNPGIDPERAERYLRSVIQYDFGPRQKESLAVFYRLAREHGLLAEMKELRFHAN